MKLINLIFFCFILGCDGAINPSGSNNNLPLECDKYEIEPNDTYDFATFTSVLIPPAQIVVCGEHSTWNKPDTDVFHFFALKSELISFVIKNNNKATDSEVVILVNSKEKPDELTYVGHFVGQHGVLVIKNYPVEIQNNGFFFLLSPLGAPTPYQMEIWSPGYYP